MKRTKKFFINGIILTFTGLIMKSIGMLFGLYISNKIGSEALGVFNLVMSVYLFAVTLATSGINIACTYLVSEQLEKHDYPDAYKAVKSCIFFSTILGMISSLVIFIFSNTISQNWLKAMVSPTPLYFVCIGLPFIAISSSVNGYFSATRKAYKSAISQVFELLVKIAVSIILLNISNSKNIENICNNLILADVISEIFSCSILLILYKFDKSKVYKNKTNKISFKKRILQIAFPVSITSYLRSGLSTLKQFIIPTRLALFGFPYAMALSEYGKVDGMTMSILLFPNVFFSSFSRLLVPEFTSLMVKNYKKRILEICNKVFLTISIFSISISFIFFFFSNEISLIVFKNLECSKYIKILSPIIVFMYSDNIIDNMLKGLNKQFGVMFCNILDLSFTICILYILLPSIGLKGYLLAILISEVFNFTISYFQLYKATGFKVTNFMLACYLFFIILSSYEIIKFF